MVLTPTTDPARVFIDSSVLFAASLSAKGHARDLIRATGENRVALVLSAFVLDETRRNLAAKAPRALPYVEDFQAAGLMQAVDPPIALVREIAQVVDAKDAPIVAGDVHAQAAYLASYDRKHLLAQAAVIHDRYGITVATPGTILRMLGYPGMRTD